MNGSDPCGIRKKKEDKKGGARGRGGEGGDFSEVSTGFKAKLKITLDLSFPSKRLSLPPLGGSVDTIVPYFYSRAPLFFSRRAV